MNQADQNDKYADFEISQAAPGCHRNSRPGKMGVELTRPTGRSDFPNQVNNVLGFPFIFRGALDVRLRDVIAPAVARAPVDSGVARAGWPEHYPPK